MRVFDLTAKLRKCGETLYASTPGHYTLREDDLDHHDQELYELLVDLYLILLNVNDQSKKNYCCG